MIERQITACVDLTPEELAAEFVDMDSFQQAEFFNQIALQVESWERGLCFQLRCVIDGGRLSNAGRAIMHQIGGCAGQ